MFFARASRRSFSTLPLRLKALDPVSPVFVSKCPEPQYDTGCTYCQAEIPANKPIDYNRQLRSSKVAIWKHMLILVETNPNDWKSKIEMEPGTLAMAIAKYKRKLSSPYHPTAVSNIFLHTKTKTDSSKTKVILYPDNKVIEMDSALIEDDESISGFVKRFLVPVEDSNELPPLISDSKFKITDHDRNLALVCGHTNRDIRCGVLAPLITKELSRVLAHKKINDVDVGVISHIGGHAFAGNLLYFQRNGESIWYGRVTPEKVQGIVEETIINGRVIEELYRG